MAAEPEALRSSAAWARWRVVGGAGRLALQGAAVVVRELGSARLQP
jgi:hypothetical protein